MSEKGEKKEAGTLVHLIAWIILVSVAVVGIWGAALIVDDPNPDDYPSWIADALTAALVITSAYAAWLLKETLAASREAVLEARRATVAAEGGIITNRLVGEAQIRCYLKIEKVYLSDDYLVPTLVVKIRNSGNSPARRVSMETYSYISYYGDDDEFEMKNKQIHIADISANDFVLASIELMTKKQIEESGKTYADIFNFIEEIEIECLVYAYDVFGNELFGMFEMYFDASYQDMREDESYQIRVIREPSVAEEEN